MNEEQDEENVSFDFHVVWECSSIDCGIGHTVEAFDLREFTS